MGPLFFVVFFLGGFEDGKIESLQVYHDIIIGMYDFSIHHIIYIYRYINIQIYRETRMT